ncbi:pyridoxal kinase [Pseudomonas syringae]|nr:pyridoxal kinase [Pseudomonas syringae]
MQRIGVNVWPLNTVQFSNHTQYKQWTGEVLAPQQIPALIDGIAAIGELGNCDAVLSGYLGSAAQGRAILTGVARIKAANPKALYLCDPVMGHPEKGCIVAPKSVISCCRKRRPWRTSCAPINWSWTASGRKPESLHDCLAMARALLARGPKAIVVKHLDYPARPPMVLKCCWSLPRPAGICAARYWHFRVSRSAWVI